MSCCRRLASEASLCPAADAAAAAESSVSRLLLLLTHLVGVEATPDGVPTPATLLLLEDS